MKNGKRKVTLQGGIDLNGLFGFDPPGNYNLSQLGWTGAPFEAQFENKIIEDRGDYELVQDESGRYVLFFKGKRSGFMPEYVSHPVKDWKIWTEYVKWRLDPKTPSRIVNFEKIIPELLEAYKNDLIITERVISGYMYFRCLIEPIELLFFL